MNGVIVNVVAVLTGTFFGLLFGRIIPDRMRSTAFSGATCCPRFSLPRRSACSSGRALLAEGAAGRGEGPIHLDQQMISFGIEVFRPIEDDLRDFPRLVQDLFIFHGSLPLEKVQGR